MATRATKETTTWLVVALLVAVALIGFSCGDDDEGAEPTPSPTEEPTPSPTEEPTGEPTPPAVQPDVLVYFLSGEQLVVGGRPTQTEAVAADAIMALLEGPQGIEVDLGWTSAIPEGTTLHGIVIEDGTATIDLSAEFESGGGSLSVISRVAQVVFTLTQFPMVDQVDISIEGVAADAIAGEGFTGQDLTRGDFLVPDFAGSPTPLILVESPFVGEAVQAPELRISGLSNTFEAALQYEVTDTDGRVVHEGFTTATAGTGTWGTFEVVLTLGAEIPPFDREGVASVTVFETSPRDGERINVVEIPIVIGPDWVSTDEPVQPAIWPAGEVVFDSPDEAAESFVAEVLGVPPTLGEFRAGDSRSGEIEVFSPGEGDAGTPVVRGVLLLRQLAPTDGWFVIGAANENASVTSPETGATVAAGPLTVEGVARGFEATVIVTALVAGDADGVLDQVITSGGAFATPEPFEVTVDLGSAAPGSTVTLLVRGGTGLDTDPGDFGAIPVVIAG